VRTLTIAERQVEVTRARCLGFEPASGFSAKWSLAPEETMWQLSATTEDASVSGAIAHLTQGVRILMTAGACTAAETST
jgi:hypothetical protein